MTKKKDPPAGNFQAPPPGAPHETTHPLDSTTLHDQLARARQNERELQPYNPVPVPPPPVAEAPPPPAAGGGSPVAGAEDMKGLSAEFNSPDPGPQTQDPPRRPAESNTDSPSRGIPRPISDPGKVITGGWGEGGAEYFALDGLELAAVTKTLFTDLQRQMAGDLRFGIATVYPQVRVRVQVLVDGIDPGVPVSEQKFELEKTRILTLEGVAMDDQSTPADALRDQAGIPKPRKQSVGQGAQRVMVDVLSGGN